MLTYPRFEKACYVFFAVAVLAAILKLSISGAQPALLKMLPVVPSASAIERAEKPPAGPEDPRIASFSADGGTEPLEASLVRSANRKDVLEASAEGSGVAPADAPVFQRPFMERGPAAGPVCGDLGDVPRSRRVVFPLPEAYFDSYDDTWGAARPQGGHEGSDLMSPTGTPEFAITDGRLVAVAGSNENGWNRLGGYTVMLEAAYDVGPVKKGDLFYYAHMDRESSLPIGTKVRAGQKIGTAGDTGEGPEVTRGKFPPHLHLGWYDANLSEERSEAKSGAMNPYPLLLWLERNGGAVSGGTDASYCQAPASPSPTPSISGQRPDLDTGDENASPRLRDDGLRADRAEGDGSKYRDSDKDQRAGGKGRGNEAKESEKAHKEATKLSMRKKPKAKIAAPLRDLPSSDPGRVAPEDGDEGEQDGEEGGSGREDGESGKERGKGRPQPERPTETRPERDQDAPTEETPKPAPAEPVRDRNPKPAPEDTDEGAPVVEEPEAVTPPKAERERPATKPYPLPDAATEEPVGDGASLDGTTIPFGDEALPEAVEKAGPVVEPDKGE